MFYPNDPLQPGPMYFLAPHKCAIFGLSTESIPRQVNYLVDEAVDMGNGANAIVSMLHHFFAHREKMSIDIRITVADRIRTLP